MKTKVTKKWLNSLRQKMPKVIDKMEGESWEEKLDEILSDTIIDGGYDYTKEDTWLGEREAGQRIKDFISHQLQLSKEQYKRELVEKIDRLTKYKVTIAPGVMIKLDDILTLLK